MSTEHGRGAWPTSGAGGTKKYKDETQPGPYYYLGSGSTSPQTSPDYFAVRGAVKAYQRALNRRLGDAYTIVVDGVYGPQTASAVTRFQSKHSDTLTVWGGIGPDSSKAILYPDLVKYVKATNDARITEQVVSGIIGHESGWDAGAVGYVDNQDLGLAQINGPSHPDLSAAERLQPVTSFKFVVDYLENAFAHFKGDTGTDPAFTKYGKLGDVIASYNLGLGGADRWIGQGRPQWYTPSGTDTARDVWAYIDTVLAG